MILEAKGAIVPKEALTMSTIIDVETTFPLIIALKVFKSNKEIDNLFNYILGKVSKKATRTKIWAANNV